MSKSQTDNHIENRKVTNIKIVNKILVLLQTTTTMDKTDKNIYFHYLHIKGKCILRQMLWNW